ncbi:hypothetical protein [Acinetobacter pragensis]|uniref:hypothetical protein n=1 Tax=Acinetobacter pragensis TaxID=1806892 RepID=UPI0033422295
MTIINGTITDSAGVPASGRLEFRQLVRFDDGTAQVTGTGAQAQVTDGQIRALDGGEFSLPASPEGTGVQIREVLGGRTFEWAARVPAADQVEYRLLEPIEPVGTPEYAPPPWLTQVFAARDETENARDDTVAAIADAHELVDTLGGLAGIQTEVGKAETAAATAASEADRAEAAADSIDMGALNARMDATDGRVSTVESAVAGKPSTGYVDTGDAATLATGRAYTDSKVAPLASAIDTLAGTAATVDELITSSRIDCNYNGTTAVVELNVTTAFTLLIAPFAMEIVDVALSFERYNLAADNTNYARAWIQKLVNGTTTQMTTTKTTQVTAPGEAIVARRRWSLTGAGVTGNPLQAGDLLQLVIGVTGAPAAVQLPVTWTVKYRPI